MIRPSLVNDSAGDSDTSNVLESFSDILTEAMKGSFEIKMLNKFCQSKSGNHPNNKIRPFSKEIQISKQLFKKASRAFSDDKTEIKPFVYLLDQKEFFSRIY